ncbi:hypothetical protein NP493_276g02052 [Ridgeia piscesae]|uniref:RGS domain-containing protein n=1 Tax=Ridgeia piscesae TaxID=27915 RepID=A0AAD9NXD2_RIDPI|nr:hypothetical protein NP493_276g02052 [Ridgeia piscesae]
MDRHSSSSDTDEALAGDKKSSSGSLKTKKKSLAKDVKDKLSFLRRRHTDTALSSKDGKLKTTPESVLHWSKSFENLLMDKQGLDLFREFLRTEFSEENIEFWIACEDYKNVHSNKLNTEAQRIYTDFIAVQAPHEINLDSKTRMLTIKNISSPSRQTFEGAQRRIQALMEKDSYRRFLHSDIYQELLGAHRASFSPP